MTQRWVLICGLVREEPSLLAKLEIIEGWKKRGIIDGVVFSTWLGELVNYPATTAALEALGAVIVELEPPLLRTVGHTVHQAKTLYYGLQAVPEGALVLKLRPDLYPIHEGMGDVMVGTDLDMTPDPAWPDIFQKKVLLDCTFLDAPYYCNDIRFYGLREDLLQLANFDLSTEFLCANTGPEQFFFRAPFARHFPAIEAFLQIYPSFAFHNEGLAQRRLDALLGSDFYLEVLATYFLIVDRYFRNGFIEPGQREREGVAEEEFSIADLFGPAGVAGMSFHPEAYASVIQDEQPIKAVLAGRFKRDDIGVRMAAALARVSDPGYRTGFAANPLRPLPAVRDLQMQISEAMAGMTHRQDLALDPEGRRYVVRGHSDRLRLAVQTDEVRRLEDEVSGLRRLVESLRAGAGQDETV